MQDHLLNFENPGYQIRRRRHLLGLSQRELAEEFGCTNQCISRWEANAVKQPLKMIHLVFLVLEARKNGDLPPDDMRF